MIKKVILATAISLCISSAYAGETAVLKVTGTLTNSACTPELSNGGVVDYGTIHLGELSPDTNNQLGQKEINFSINCTAATKVSWSAADDRTDSRANITVKNGRYGGADASESYFLYGVGKTGTGVNIGNYSLFIKDFKATVDGESKDVIIHNTGWNTSTWANDGTAVRNDTITNVSVADPGTLEPVAFTTAVFPLVTALAIKDTTSLGIIDDTSLDGQATITLKYL
ncbi:MULTISPECIES: DUF1120 domain-containing protein [Enterobacter cloacae complex]|uniref:DUF1120 domain-containing protein n=1 Tax=Enterobacter cloacae complex TaxID=354276 RepID=UPI0007926F7E|nr:protein YhcF [Enterobacter cloacae]